MSVTELATIAICEKLETLEYKQDTLDAQKAHERFVNNCSKTISADEMWAHLGWDEEVQA